MYDTELASAVFDRWNQGLPTAETSLFKAASALGYNPYSILDNARTLSKTAAAQPMPGMPQQGAPMPPQQPPGPMPGAVLQKEQVTPATPPQVPESPEGNIDSLLSELQGAHGAQATDNGGMPPNGMPEPPPPPPTPEERIQQFMPGVDVETLQRYSQKLMEFEEQINMSVTDPKQMQKFIQQTQKSEAKVIDEALKQMADDTPQMPMAGGGQKPQQDQPQKPQAKPAQPATKKPVDPKAKVAALQKALKTLMSSKSIPAKAKIIRK